MHCPPLFHAPLTDAEAAELTEVLKALADRVRLRLVSMIASAPGGEACACDLAGPLQRSQPTISHHLAQLVRTGLVSRQQRGRWAWVRINDDRVAAVCSRLRPPTAAP